ncbi:PRKCA-binding protein isoform X1 [Thrips palmi]|uniref:PRKCA-binding protein n=1 Tax=Thrips palmi TaxID=161013 RepID=A0A6P8YN41_THRPL|nr:PRKCA-binding protein isoform X1 [Thrips palmi]XP_034238605.1 PRKCA-binding protein isoform X1 [Thrips palmi]
MFMPPPLGLHSSDVDNRQRGPCGREDRKLLDLGDGQSNQKEKVAKKQQPQRSHSLDKLNKESSGREASGEAVFPSHEYGVEAYGDDYLMNGYQDTMGMTVTSGVVTLTKENNFVGISIGGGAPLCPCLYIAQVFDNTPASRDGTLQSGDEIIGVNGVSCKGKTKVQAAKMIQASKELVAVTFNKLHADPAMGKSLDIVLKKAKHRLVEKMSATTADALGLSRAILCNDALVRKLDELKAIETEYRGMVEHAKRVLKAYFELLQVYKAFGCTFAEIGSREPQPRASETFTQFANYHRNLEKHGIQMLRTLKPILSDLGTYLHKAIPDTQLTIKKYADAKFEYLSYCLKVKEMDDEEKAFNEVKEPLYRVETGNYEYRLILRCRQDARAKFARLRSDVLVKLELLDNKHVQDISAQLEKFVGGLAAYHSAALQTLDPPDTRPLFPIEMDLSRSAFQYKSTTPLQNDGQDDDEDDQLLTGEEAKEEKRDEPPLLLLPDL